MDRLRFVKCKYEVDGMCDTNPNPEDGNVYCTQRVRNECGWYVAELPKESVTDEPA